MSKKSQTHVRLGKGLEALLPKIPFAGGRSIVNISLSEIVSNPFQPRLEFDEDELKSLASSIKKIGVAQPILVRKRGEKYELIAGERRYRASEIAGLDKIPVIIREMTDQESLTLAMVENIERHDLSPVEEAKGYKRLVDEFGVTHRELSDIFNKSRSKISNTLRLLNLPIAVQDRLLQGRLTEGHARALLSLESEDEMVVFCDEIDKYHLNVRDVEGMVRGSLDKRQVESVADAQLSLFQSLEDDLGRMYKADFKIKAGKKSGSITIKYSGKEHLEALLRLLKK